MKRSAELERKLREVRYSKAVASARRVFEAAGLAPADYAAVPLDEVDSIWPQYLTRLKAEVNSRVRWPAKAYQAVQRHLDVAAERVGDLRAICLPQFDSERIGVEVPASTVLRAATRLFVSAAADLMLTTPEALDGICVELNHLGTGDEFEVIAWGAFSAR